MRRIISLFTTTCIFLWILPLGAFIKPSQEKMACDGQRAFHMCSIEMTKNSSGASSKVSLANASGGEFQEKSKASGGNDLLLSKIAEDALRSKSFSYEVVAINAYPLILRSLEHVPKI